LQAYFLMCQYICVKLFGFSTQYTRPADAVGPFTFSSKENCSAFSRSL